MLPYLLLYFAFVALFLCWFCKPRPPHNSLFV